MDLLALKNWFLMHQRDLPWRNNPTPYQVWISEVMLQQTQVAVVIGYFQRWMSRFPTIQSISEASLEEVIKMWEGLGYYSRARCIHRAARYLVQVHGGELPASRKELETIPGLGPYTVGAILSFAFHQKAAAVDGNVLRVLARYTGLEEDISLQKTRQGIWDYAERLLPEESPWLIVEGLIELGATLCTRQPKCFQCPLSGQCLGLQKGIADLLPIKKKKEAITLLKRDVAIVMSGDFFLLRKGEKGGIMADLYEFPYLEQASGTSLHAYLSQNLNLNVQMSQTFPMIRHHFTRYRAMLYPSLWRATRKEDISAHVWVHTRDLKSLPFSSGHRQILKFMENHAHFTH